MTETLRQDLNRIRAARQTARPRYYRPSKLNPHRSKIEELLGIGASLEEIRIWLQQKANVKVAKSTISRAVERWNSNDA